MNISERRHVGASRFAATLAATLAGTTLALPAQALTLDPNPSTLRIPAPSQARLAAKADVVANPTFAITYAPAGHSNLHNADCVEFPAEARQALEYAARLWAVHLQTGVSITARSCWTPIAGATLARGSAPWSLRSSNLPVTSVDFPAPLVVALTGSNPYIDPPAISLTFNATPPAPWHFGRDGEPGSGVDFVTAAMSAIGHPLGMTSFATVAWGAGYLGYGYSPTILDWFVEDAQGTRIASLPNASLELATALQGGSLLFNGANAKAAHGGVRVPLHAPTTWAPDESLVHLADAFAGTADALLTRTLAVGESIHRPGPVTLGMLKDMGWSLAASTAFSDNAITAHLDKAATQTGHDVMLTIDLANYGPDTSDGQETSVNFSTDVQVAWKSPGCFQSLPFVVDCFAGNIVPGGTKRFQVAFRAITAGTLTMSIPVGGNTPDPDLSNNTANLTLSVTASPAGLPKQRYRLYSPVTREHHFTTDLNEYNVLGSYVGTWVQEGTVGKVLDNPGTYNSVVATPYYRLYNTANAQHHWTTDANEYYTLIQFPQYNAESVDGWLLPTQAAGTIPLYRLMYPYAIPVAGLHHWTIDPVEYSQLITVYGWVGEGGSGFVIP